MIVEHRKLARTSFRELRDGEIKRLHAADLTAQQTADELGMTLGAVRQRLSALSLYKPPKAQVKPPEKIPAVATAVAAVPYEWGRGETAAVPYAEKVVMLGGIDRRTIRTYAELMIAANGILKARGYPQIDDRSEWLQ